MSEHVLEPVDQKQLDEIIKKHLRFSTGRLNGARAVLKFKMLAGLNFRGADLSGADFTGSDMSGSYLCGGNYSGATFSSCNLNGANFERSNLTRADFRGADLTDANMTGADLTKADMREGSVAQISKPAGARKWEEKPDQDGGQAQPFIEESGQKEYEREAEVDLSQIREEKTEGEEKVFFLGEKPDGEDGRSRREAEIDLSLSETTAQREAVVDLSQDEESLCPTRQACVESVDGSDSSSRVSDLLLRGEDGSAAHSGPDSERDDELRARLREHALWIQFSGGKGERMDASGISLCGVPDLGRYPLTAMKAEGTIFRGLHLIGAHMQSAVFDGADFRDTNLREADLRGSSCRGARFSRADLARAKMGSLSFGEGNGTLRAQRCDFSGANFRHANLEGASFKDAILIGADLQGALLRKADFRGADLREANLTGADLEGVVWDKAATE